MDNDPIATGMVPFNPLESKAKLVSPVRNPNSVGIGPVKPLVEKFNDVNWVK